MHEPKKFDHLLGFLGLSDELLKNHFTLYEGYVNNVNKIENILEKTESGSVEYAELQRRFGWEWNGMRLHELYFGNITRTHGDLVETHGNADLVETHGNASLREAILKEWGSFEAWEKDFRAMAAMRGIGWIVLYHDKETGRLFNVWVNEHDGGHLAGATPLLVMDVFEHAYVTDYGIKRAEYIEVFMKSVDWEVVGSRFSK